MPPLPNSDNSDGFEQLADDQSSAESDSTKGPEHERNTEADIEALLTTLAQLARNISALAPDELKGQATNAAHELLVSLRLLINWLLERMDRVDTQPVNIEDIPIQ